MKKLAVGYISVLFGEACVRNGASFSLAVLVALVVGLVVSVVRAWAEARA